MLGLTDSDGDEFAADLIECTVLNEGLCMALAQVYVDESGTHAGSPCMSIGGFIFKKGQATEFSNRWRSILKSRGLEYFRMTDCVNRQGGFETWSIAECDALERLLISNILKFAEFGFAVSIREQDFYEVFGGDVGGFKSKEIVGSAYAFCLRSALVATGIWTRKSSFTGKITYFFESGHKDQGNANMVISEAIKPPPSPVFDNLLNVVNDYHYAAHVFADKRDFPPLQAADLIAWLWRDATKKGLDNKPERKDLGAIRDNMHIWTVWNGKELLELQNDTCKDILLGIGLKV